MTTTATHSEHYTAMHPTEPVLFLAFELREKTWKLGFTTIEVNRRKRRAKSDGLDVRKLLTMRIRAHHGERGVWRVVHVPSIEAEDQRHLHRDLETVQQERASTIARIKGILRSQGIRLTSVNKLPEQLDALRLWDGSPIPSGLRRRLLRVYAHYQFLSEQIAELEAERRALLQSAQE